MARDMKPPEHVIERKLITIWRHGKAEEKRRRGTVIDGVLGYTDDGWMVLVPTGKMFNPPAGADGMPRQDVDPEDLLLWMLGQDPEGWAKAKTYGLGQDLIQGLKDRLSQTRDSYPPDRKFTPPAG